MWTQGIFIPQRFSFEFSVYNNWSQMFFVLKKYFSSRFSQTIISFAKFHHQLFRKRCFLKDIFRKGHFFTLFCRSRKFLHKIFLKEFFVEEISPEGISPSKNFPWGNFPKQFAFHFFVLGKDLFGNFSYELKVHKKPSFGQIHFKLCSFTLRHHRYYL